MSDEKPQYTEESPFTKEKLLEGFKEGKFKRIVILTGAGISVSAGIPDFRSPGTGLYDNLKEYNLPSPQAIFDIDFFKENPTPFYKLAESFLSLDKFDATPTHHFCKMLYDKGYVREYVTQNIDNLESKAGFTQDQILQAHGANFGAECAMCEKEQDRKELDEKIQKGEIMYCSDKACQEKWGPMPVKPKIVFFGQSLP